MISWYEKQADVSKAQATRQAASELGSLVAAMNASEPLSFSPKNKERLARADTLALRLGMGVWLGVDNRWYAAVHERT